MHLTFREPLAPSCAAVSWGQLPPKPPGLVHSLGPCILQSQQALWELRQADGHLGYGGATSLDVTRSQAGLPPALRSRKPQRSKSKDDLIKRWKQTPNGPL